MHENSALAAGRRVLSVLLVVVGFLAMWQVFALITQPPEYLLPSPIAIGKELSIAPGWYFSHASRTIGATLLGFLTALLIGCVAAIGIVYSRILENTLYTLLVALNSIPKIALAPLFIIWLGTGLTSKVAVSFTIAVFAIVVDTVLGLRSVDPDALDLFRSMRGTPLQTLVRLRFPNALPYLFAGMKVAISLALVGAIAGEFVASQGGARLRHLSGTGKFSNDARVRRDILARRAWCDFVLHCRIT